MNPRLLALGDAAWTLEFGDAVDPAIHAAVMGAARALAAEAAAGRLPAVIEWVPTFRSLTVHFDPLHPSAAGLAEQLVEVAAAAPPAVQAGRRLRVPVLFGGEAGADLVALAQACGLAPEAVVARMAATVFRVYLLGFMPGFPYLGGLPPELARPRLATPRTRVPARSLAVADVMCAIYPYESPGGWHLLGRTPVPLFDAADEKSPALFSPGDEVMWQPVDRETYARLEGAGERGELDRAGFLVAPDAPWPA